MNSLNQSGFMAAALGFVILGLLVGFIYLQRDSSQATSLPSPAASSSTDSPTPTPIASVSAKKTQVSPSVKPTATAKASATPAPTSSLSINANTSSGAEIQITPSCASSHDNLGNHLDVNVSFKDMDRLDSKDLIVAVIDTKTQSRSESHVSINLINNLTIPAHKYAYAFQGSTVPLELVADGRDYIVWISKALYKSDGTIDVYTQALEKKFSKQCNF